MRNLEAPMLLDHVCAAFIIIVLFSCCEFRARTEPPPTEAERTKKIRTSPAMPVSSAAGEAMEKTGRKVVVYYFHKNERPDICLQMEALTDERLMHAFPDELDEGTLEWRVINIDKPDNKHFVADFSLDGRSLIVTEMKDGTRLRWKNCKGVSSLVGNRVEYGRYVEDEVRAYLEAK